MPDNLSINRQRMHHRKRFVALFDILGFSDIVKKKNIQAVIDVFENLKHGLKDYIQVRNDITLTNNIHVLNFSDTYLLYTHDIKPLDFTLLMWTCEVLFNEAFKQGLYIRGAVTVGDLYINKDSFLGEPIIRAYEMEKEQEWIGCWIDEKVFMESDELIAKPYLSNKSIINFPIPLKSGKVRNLYALNWIKQFNTLSKVRTKKTTTYSEVMSNCKFDDNKSSDWQSRRKVENTKIFIDYIFKNSL